MSNWGWILCAACVLAAAAVISWNIRRTAGTMVRIERMLEEAMDGSFTEEKFDESRMSALETRFAHYLCASVTSARNVALERDKIKTLIADISHQTKTPVANLLLYCELLQEESLPESARSNVEALHVQTEKLRFLIDALVKLSRLESGIIALNARRQALQPVLEQVVRQYASAADVRGLYLRLEDTQACASFDAKWTAEAICNIVDNALKYTQRGGVAIAVVPYDMFVRIDIADSGVGIAEEEQAKIFARFYRSTRSGDQEGVGIGLFLAREILAGEGGYIKVVSDMGRGSVFSVFLPA